MPPQSAAHGTETIPRHDMPAQKPPGLHTTAREPKRAQFRPSALQTHHQNSTRRPPREEERKKIVAREGKKKREIFLAPTLWAPHSLGPTLRGPTLRCPTLRGPTLRGHIFLGLGHHPSGPHPSGPRTSMLFQFYWPKSVWPKSVSADCSTHLSCSAQQFHTWPTRCIRIHTTLQLCVTILLPKLYLGLRLLSATS